MYRGLFCILLFSYGIGSGVAQTTSSRQKALEEQRIRLKNEIQQINTLLFSSKKTRKNVVTEVEDLQVKLSVREELIRVTNAQVNYLTRKINLNERTISEQRKELEVLEKIMRK